MLEHIKDGDETLVVILRTGYTRNGLSFFTSDDSSLQLGYMQHPRDYVIPAHVHNRVARTVEKTMEVLFVKSGKVLLDIYTESGTHLGQRQLCPGDVALLASGGHGMTMLDDAEVIEVKQGPYLGDKDKVRIG
jgi:hypothetical protein